MHQTHDELGLQVDGDAFRDLHRLDFSCMQKQIQRYYDPEIKTCSEDLCLFVCLEVDGNCGSGERIHS